MKQLPRYVTIVVIKGHKFFKVQKATSLKDKANGAGHWVYQRCFKTLDQAIAFLESVEGARK